MKNVQFTSNKVPPDGGYGWVIAFAMAVNTFIYIPLMHCFGLIFKDTFAELGLSATQGSLIINLHGAFGLLTGLLNGILLKMFGYRKVALAGAVLYFSGVTLTSFSRSFQYFVISYGIVACLSPIRHQSTNNKNRDFSSGGGNVALLLHPRAQHLFQEEAQQSHEFHGHHHGARLGRDAPTGQSLDEVLQSRGSDTDHRGPLRPLLCHRGAAAAGQVARERRRRAADRRKAK
jgi:hypothetical protein